MNAQTAISRLRKAGIKQAICCTIDSWSYNLNEKPQRKYRIWIEDPNDDYPYGRSFCSNVSMEDAIEKVKNHYNL